MEPNPIKIINFIKKPGISGIRTWLLLGCVMYAIKKGIVDDPEWSSLLGEPIINELKRMTKEVK